MELINSIFSSNVIASIEPLSTQGMAENTVNGRKPAHLHFKNYLEEYRPAVYVNNEEPTLKMLDESFGAQLMFQEFAKYLCSCVKGNGDPLNSGTILQYFGCIKEMYLLANPGHDLFRGIDSTSSWYTKLRKNLERLANETSLANGLRIHTKAHPLYRYAYVILFVQTKSPCVH